MSAFLEPSWGHLELLKASWPILGAFGGHLGGILGLSWTILGPSCAILAFFGVHFASQNTIYSALRMKHSSFDVVVVASSIYLAPHSTTWPMMVTFGGILGPFWGLSGYLGSYLGAIGASWEPSWGHLGAILGPLGGGLDP